LRLCGSEGVDGVKVEDYDRTAKMGGREELRMSLGPQGPAGLGDLRRRWET